MDDDNVGGETFSHLSGYHLCQRPSTNPPVEETTDNASQWPDAYDLISSSEVDNLDELGTHNSSGFFGADGDTGHFQGDYQHGAGHGDQFPAAMPSSMEEFSSADYYNSSYNVTQNTDYDAFYSPYNSGTCTYGPNGTPSYNAASSSGNHAQPH
jgi:hypothetical protein